MSFYDYKVVPAPRHLKKARGVTDATELLCLNLGEVLTEQGRAGWEYVRAETLPAEAPGGMFRRAVEETVSVLVFRRERENLEPRLAAEPLTPPAAVAPVVGPARAEPPVSTRPEPTRAEPDAATRPEPASAEPDDAPTRPQPPVSAETRTFSERVREAGSMRREPPIRNPPAREPARSAETPSPLRPTPTLGPADRS